MLRRLALGGLLVWTLWHFDPNNRWYPVAKYETEAECQREWKQTKSKREFACVSDENKQPKPRYGFQLLN
jgi:hypothetical protein